MVGALLNSKFLNNEYLLHSLQLGAIIIKNAAFTVTNAFKGVVNALLAVLDGFEYVPDALLAVKDG